MTDLELHPTMQERKTARLFLVFTFLAAGFSVIGIGVAARAFLATSAIQTALSWQYGFLAVVVAIGFLSLLRRYRQRLLWEILFTVTLFLGVWYALFFVLPLGWALAVASVCTLTEIFIRNTAVHNVYYIIGAAGVAINFAGWLSPDVLIAGLVVLTIYDMVAGPPGGPVQSLAAELIDAGIVPGIVIPARSADLFSATDEAVKSNAALLGAGDLILPLCLVAKASYHGVEPALIVLGGLVVGALVLGRTGDPHPRAALPALAAGTAVPFIVLRLLSIV